MEAMAAIGARIDAIEARLSSLSAPPGAAPARTPTGAPGTSPTSAGLAGGLASSLAGAGAGAGTFEAALAAAQGRGAGAATAAGPETSAFTTLLAGLRPAALTTSATAGSAPAAAGAVAATSSAPAAAPAPAVSAADLRSYGNGRIPPEALSPIGGGERLWAPAAAAFTTMREAARAQGVTLGVNDSYRSFDEQVDMARRKGLYSQGGLAAQPGTSDHGWGKAVDLQLDARAQSWMRSNAERFGFAEDTPREPWHWGFTG